MSPEIHVLGISLKSFGIVFACGFLAAGVILVRRLKELGQPVDYAYEMAFAALVGGVVGSRLYFVIQNYSQVKHDLLGSLFSGSGLVWYGGVIGGAIAVLGWAAWRGILNLWLLDLASVPLAMGYAIGRIGCQVSGDGDYGKVSTLPWVMSYPHGTVPTPPGVRVQPTPIYETLAMGLVAWWLWRMRDRYRPWALFAFYLLLSGIERLLVEFYAATTGRDRPDRAPTGKHRADDRGRGLAGITAAAWRLAVRRRHRWPGFGNGMSSGSMRIAKGLRGRRRYRDKVRANRAYLAGFGTAGSMLAGASVLFVLASAVVAFRGWPQVGEQSPPTTVVNVSAGTPAGTPAGSTAVRVSLRWRRRGAPRWRAPAPAVAPGEDLRRARERRQQGQRFRGRSSGPNRADG